MKAFDFYETMMPNVSHREKIFYNDDGSVRVWCGFEPGNGKKLYYIGSKNVESGTMRDRIIEMRENYIKDNL